MFSFLSDVNQWRTDCEKGTTVRQCKWHYPERRPVPESWKSRKFPRCILLRNWKVNGSGKGKKLKATKISNNKGITKIKKKKENSIVIFLNLTIAVVYRHFQLMWWTVMMGFPTAVMMLKLHQLWMVKIAPQWFLVQLWWKIRQKPRKENWFIG